MKRFTRTRIYEIQKIRNPLQPPYPCRHSHITDPVSTTPNTSQPPNPPHAIDARRLVQHVRIDQINQIPRSQN